ncbi:hypothetical protein F8O01_15390 [Pseudoclavibacter chungangensis]|uniref:Uncharacterized protein n=1 Tax=Pseudoclavibacter chungangensis TaxID=587635 RepID=A0A7J5BN98_9MICO|nr:hypothetical protein [Pseudoclavibacter chungangensis]KAB1653250.1 hypothetical protein F8O01_15390 [Pseudoclavibacter chungangensis]NYJ66934.1 hypothetical protein [Pseudoclavibacter chungangensis]
MTNKTAAELKAERAKLNAQIRAAERAEKKAAARALLDAKHSLGEWLADSLGATSAEEVETLRRAVDLDHAREWLTAQGSAEDGHEEATSGDGSVVDYSTSYEPADGYDEAGISTTSTAHYGS